MPSITSNKNKLALPPFPPPEGRVCIPVSVPDDPEWIGLFLGAIFRLGQQIWYDRDVAHTAKSVADVWMGIFNETTEKAWDCMDSCLCYLRRNPATGRYQYSANGLDWFEVDDGPWIDAPTMPVWPPPTPRTGTAEEARCDASYAAALVLQSLYQKTFGVFINWANWSAFSLAQEMADWADQILGGLFNFDVLISAAQELHDNESAFQDGGFPDSIVTDVQNILYCRSEQVDGVVSFDFDGVLSDFAAVGTTPYPGLNFLLQLYIGEEGLNTAGSVNAGAGECAPCTIEETFWIGAGVGGAGVATWEVMEGEEITITPNPTDFWYYGAPTSCTATGIPGITPPTGSRSLTSPFCSMLCLVGTVGAWTYSGEPFVFTAPASGTLYFGCNDDYFGDNSGSIRVTLSKS